MLMTEKNKDLEMVMAFAINVRCEVRDIGDTSVGLSAQPGTNQQTYLLMREVDNANDRQA